MGREAEKIFDKAMKDPENFYKTPEQVLSDDRLTQEQKDAILNCWEQDELDLIRAEWENMCPKTDAPQAVEVLEEIKEAEKQLKNPTEGGKAA